MAGIPKIKSDWNFSKLAQTQNKKLMSLPLQDTNIAKILWNENSVDCYIVNGKNGFPIEASSHAGSIDTIVESVIKIMDKLQEITLPDINVYKEMIKASFKNIV